MLIFGSRSVRNYTPEELNKMTVAFLTFENVEIFWIHAPRARQTPATRHTHSAYSLMLHLC